MRRGLSNLWTLIITLLASGTIVSIVLALMSNASSMRPNVPDRHELYLRYGEDLSKIEVGTTLQFLNDSKWRVAEVHRDKVRIVFIDPHDPFGIDKFKTWYELASEHVRIIKD